MIDRQSRTTRPPGSRPATLSTRYVLVIVGLSVGLAGVNVNSAIGHVRFG